MFFFLLSLSLASRSAVCVVGQNKAAPEGAAHSMRGGRGQATPFALNQARQRFQPSSAASLR